MDMYQDIINKLATNDYYQVKKDIDKLINDSTFIQTIVKVHNPVIFDRFIKMCEFKIDTSPLYEERNKFIKKIIFNLTEDNICDFFGVNDKRIANRYLIEYIVSYYFSDNYYNFMTNLYQMTSYLRTPRKNHLVTESNINLYKEFVELRNMSFIDKLLFFRLLLDDRNIRDMFYDDMNRVREDSHKELVDNVLKLNHDNGIYEEDLTNKLGVDVYLLDGEEFYGFVRNITIPSSDFSHEDYVYARGKRLGSSFSYIGNKNIGYMGNSGVLLYYDNIDYRKIMYVYHGDAHTKKMDKMDDYLSEKENEILLPANLVAKTNNYNEIYIKGSDEGIKPTAIVCFDSVTSDDISFAKRFNLSILIIKKEKYKSIDTFDEDYDLNTYVI